jgi:hypothetical protein
VIKGDGQTTCNACGAPKPDDRYRACPDCRQAWRLGKRKPDGPAERIERLRAALTKIEAMHRDAQHRDADDRTMVGGSAWQAVAMRMAHCAMQALAEET